MGRTLGILSTLVGIVALVVSVLWLRRPADSTLAEEGRPPFRLPVTLADVTRGDLQPRVNLSGNVRSPARASLAFEVAGILEELHVQRVDRITAGQVLARLRSADQELAMALAEADLTLSKREFEKLQAGDRVEVTARLVAELDERRANEALALSEVERGQRLLLDKVVSQADIDRLQAELAAARARTAAKTQQLAESEAGTRDEDIAIAKARVAQVQARLDAAEQELAKTELVAPRDGIVLDRAVSVGDYLAVGDPVFEVIDLADLEVEIDIPGRYAANLDFEPAVTLTMDDLPEFRLDTILTARVPVADERSRNFIGLVRIPKGDENGALLRPGMFVRVALDLRTLKDALLVPSDAVMTVPDDHLVVRVLPGSDPPRAQLIPVRILAEFQGVTAIAPLRDAELGPGDKVVMTGAERAFEGALLLLPDSLDAGNSK